MQDRSTSQLLDAISSWRSSHSGDASFGAIDAKLKSLEDDLKGDADGDLKNGNKSSMGGPANKPSFPSSNDFAARMAAAKSKSGARSGATA